MVIQAGDVTVSLMDAQGTVYRMKAHLRRVSMECVPSEEGQWVAKPTTKGHRSERRIQL